MRTDSFIREFSEGLTSLINTVDSQELILEEYRLKATKYKAYFFQKGDLAEVLEKQIKANHGYTIGDFDGCSDEYRTLEDMVRRGIITKSDYEFCKC